MVIEATQVGRMVHYATTIRYSIPLLCAAAEGCDGDGHYEQG